MGMCECVRAFFILIIWNGVVGTDTTGCVRVPASFCGIIGFRPSHGVVSTIGVSPNSQSLDTVGMQQTLLIYIVGWSCYFIIAFLIHGYIVCGILDFPLMFYNIMTILAIVSVQLMILNNDSIIALGCLASDPLVLHRLGHALLQLNPMEPKRRRSIIIADDLFQFSKVHLQKTGYVISKTVEKLSSCKFHIFAMIYPGNSYFLR